MIVFDLRCANAHVFEAWFGSSASYAEQQSAGLLACPICGDANISKAVMAPNIAAKGNRHPFVNPPQTAAPPAPPDADAPVPAEAVKAALALIAQAQAKALERSEWVGRAFTDRARAMHVGEVPDAPIHGQATLEQARALREEGIAVAPLIIPFIPPEALN